MNAKSLSTVVLLAFVAVSIGYFFISESQTNKADGGTTSASADEPAKPIHKVIAYYFHNTQRCMTCNKIEHLAEETLREQFADALGSGILEWHVVNMEQPPNTHFVQDFQLVASSLVLVDLYDGQQRDWTNMEKVWQYVHDDEARFKQYVAEQTRKYLES